MQIQNKHIQNGLLVISGKEHGRLFVIKDGVVEEFDHLQEHPPEYSDNEGFFLRAGHGERYGSGNPREEDDERNLERYLDALKKELSAVIKELQPETLYITAPQHLRNHFKEVASSFTDAPVQFISHGNYVKSSNMELQALLEGYKNEQQDPTDPASVAGKENAEEKRKILETAQLRQS